MATINGNVPDDADAKAVDIGFQSVPLAEEQKLYISVKFDFLLCLSPAALQRLWAAQTDVLRPLLPRLHSKPLLQRHEQGIVRQPRGVLRRKGGRGVPVPLPAPGLCQTQQGQAVFIDRAVIHPPGIVPPLAGGQLRLRQKAVLASAPGR